MGMFFTGLLVVMLAGSVIQIVRHASKDEPLTKGKKVNEK